jgi:RNA polymerase sigma-70 factor (ECF subfamily)
MRDIDRTLTGEAASIADVERLEFDAFFEANRHRLFAALCLATGDRHEAEEITQDAFVRLFERWSTVSRMDDPNSYLFVTGMNLFRRRLRRSKLAALIPAQRSGADSAFDTIDDRDVLVRALRALPPRQRAAIVMTTILDIPTDEAARVLRIKGSTVRTLATQARSQMRLTIGDER